MHEIYLASNHFFLESFYGQPGLHRHAAAHIVVSAAGLCRVEADGETKEAEGFLIPSGTLHTVETSGAGVLLFFFDSTTSAAEEIRVVSAIAPDKAEAIRGAYARLKNGAAPYETFLNTALREAGLKPFSSRLRDPRLIEAKRFIDRHIGEALTAEKVAAAVFLSESRFSRLFRAEAGITFASYLKTRKLYHAYKALAEGKNITEAALAGGFAGPSHLASVNKALLGLTAGELSGKFVIHAADD